MNAVTSLLDHQRTAVEKLRPLKVGALFMDMGTGKSRTAIELALRRRPRCKRVLWFCPVSLKETIRQEIVKHVAGAQVYVFDGKTAEGQIPEAFWYVVGIESMSTSARLTLAAISLADATTMVIVDESSYIKGHRASRTQWITEIGRRATWRAILTGTPLTQGVVDLFAQMRFLSPSILGYANFGSFAANHLEYHPRQKGRIVRAHNTALLAAKVAPYTYQVTKKECLDLPAKLYESRWAAMTLEQRRLYTQVRDEFLDLIDTTPEYAQDKVLFRLFLALQQIACGFYRERTHPGAEAVLHTVPHGRLDLLVETLGEIPEAEKVIVWVHWTNVLQDIVARLREVSGDEVVTFYGGMTEIERSAAVDRFRGPARFFVATPQSGSHGLTLTEAAYQIFYTNSFRYSERLQAEDRCHRIGQTRSVTYIDVAVTCSIEERIQEALTKKASVAELFRQQVGRVKGAKSLREALKELLP